MNITEYHALAQAHFHPPFNIDLNDPKLVKFKFNYTNNKPVAGALVFSAAGGETLYNQGENLVFLNDYTGIIDPNPNIKSYTGLEHCALAHGNVGFQPGLALHEADYVGATAGYVHGFPAQFYREKDGKLEQVSLEKLFHGLKDDELMAQYAASTRKVIYRKDSMSIIEDGRETVLREGDKVILQDGYLIVTPKDTSHVTAPALLEYETPECASLPKITALATNLLDPSAASQNGIDEIGLFKSELIFTNDNGSRALRNIDQLDKLSAQERQKNILREKNCSFSIPGFFHFVENAVEVNLEKIDFRLTDLGSEDVIQSFIEKNVDLKKNQPEQALDFDIENMEQYRFSLWYQQIIALQSFLLPEDKEIPIDRPSFHGDFSFTIPKTNSAEDVRKVQEMVESTKGGIRRVLDPNYNDFTLAANSISINAMIETNEGHENLEAILTIADKSIIGGSDMTAAVLSISRSDKKAIAAYKEKYGFDPFNEKLAPEALIAFKDIIDRTHAVGKPVAVAAAQFSNDPQGLFEVLRMGADEVILPSDPAVIATARYAQYLLAQERLSA